MASKYTRAARGQPCLVRIPSICNHNPETTVFAHLNGGGMGAKHRDIFGAFACSDCHQWLDSGYVQEDTARWARDAMHYEGMVRTQNWLIEHGILIL